ncbi:MAG: FmdB family transcriptional regulator [Verrucomicrobia bacterium]|nr:FmdB family transcriptional regulator [Verrucomicrobiota bacterium]
MPIYEYYCPRNHTVYQFYAKTLAQGKSVPKCPENPVWPMQKTVSQFAFTGRAVEPAAAEAGPEGEPDDARLEAAMAGMEQDFASVDENDPRAMARMMRKMADLTGEKIDAEMEEVVRKLEEGMDPEKLEEQLGSGAAAGGDVEDDPYGQGMSGDGGAPQTDREIKEARMRWRVRRATTAPRRDPVLYDYD